MNERNVPGASSREIRERLERMKVEARELRRALRLAVAIELANAAREKGVLSAS